VIPRLQASRQASLASAQQERASAVRQRFMDQAEEMKNRSGMAGDYGDGGGVGDDADCNVVIITVLKPAP
jgi:hypothetical protein